MSVKPHCLTACRTPASPIVRRCGGVRGAGAPRRYTQQRRRRDVVAATSPSSSSPSSSASAPLSVDRLLALWDAHVATEFTEKSADAAVASMVPHATVNHVPTLTGGVGTAALRQFYAVHFIPRMPPDVEIVPLSRVVGAVASSSGAAAAAAGAAGRAAGSAGRQCVVDEFLFGFTFSTRMDWMLPGLEPNGRRVRVPFIVVVEFEGALLAAERIYWDQASVLKQLGLLPDALAPHVAGAEQADKAADAVALPSNGLIPVD